MKNSLKNSFILRYFLVSALIFSIALYLSFAFTKVLMERGRLENESSRLFHAAQQFADLSAKENRPLSALISEIYERYPSFLPFGIAVINQQHQVIGPRLPGLNLTIEQIEAETPTEPMQVHQMNQNNEILSLRLPDNEILFLDMMKPGQEPIVPLNGPRPAQIKSPIKTFGTAMRTFLIFGYIFFLLSTLYLFRRMARLANTVLSELKSGNLKARFPENSFDNFGSLAHGFNEMAGEIENLVVSLRQSERSRKDLLQELVHDLKTPVTSLESLMETLRDHAEKLTEEQKADFLNTGISEVQYFGRLVNDLLFVSDLIDPTHSIQKKPVKINEVIVEEMNVLKTGSLQIVTNFDLDGDYKTAGNIQLIKRLIRNALDNATAFADSRIEISVIDEGQHWRIDVINDGQGIDRDKIDSFGEKSISRKLNKKHNNRISIGLGAYIMKKIAMSHGGTIQIENLESSNSGASGTRLSISLGKMT